MDDLLIIIYIFWLPGNWCELAFHWVPEKAVPLFLGKTNRGLLKECFAIGKMGSENNAVMSLYMPHSIVMLKIPLCFAILRLCSYTQTLHAFCQSPAYITLHVVCCNTLKIEIFHHFYISYIKIERKSVKNLWILLHVYLCNSKRIELISKYTLIRFYRLIAK